MQPAPLQHGDDFGGGIGGSKVSLPYPGLAEVHSGALMEELSSGSMSMTPFSGTRVGTAPIGGFRGGSKGAGYKGAGYRSAASMVGGREVVCKGVFQVYEPQVFETGLLGWVSGGFCCTC